jgi:hypothetical protein
MSYVNLNSINKTSYLHPPPETSMLNKHFNFTDKYKFVKYKETKSNNENNINIKNENGYAYSLIWKGIHYVSNFLNSLPNEFSETENAYVVFIKCISELLPNEEYSRHTKEFISKYPLENLKTSTDKFKWSYKLHSYINFMKFVKNLKYYILKYSKNQVETILNNYCVSLEFNKHQIQTCNLYINNKIKMISNDNELEFNDKLEEYIFVENISYQEALKKYTITDTNIITKNDWGPTIWMMIHFFAANLKKNKINIYIEFIKTLMYVIPCEECRKHLRENLKNQPLVINKNTDRSIDSNNLFIFEWSCNLHNLVNKQLNKPVYNYCKSLYYKYLDNYNSIYEYL